MHNFTESHLRREIEKAAGRAVALHVVNGAAIRGIVRTVDKDQDGFIEITLDTAHGLSRVVTPVENIVAYEVIESASAK